MAFGAHVTPSGRLLGPCATLPGQGRAGEPHVRGLGYNQYADEIEDIEDTETN